MLKIIKKSIFSFLILTLIFTIGCTNDKKENSSSKVTMSDSASITQDSSTTDGMESITESLPLENNIGDSIPNSTFTDSFTTQSTITENNPTIQGENISVEVSSSEVSSIGSNESTSSASSQISSSAISSSPKDTTTKKQTTIYKNTVSNILDAIKAGEFEKVNNNLITDETESQPLGFDAATIKRVKKIFAKLDYKILSAKYITDFEAKVTVKISALNFEEIFLPYMQKSIKLTRSGKEYTEKQLNKKLDRAFDACFNNKSKMVTTKVTLHLVKCEDSWKLRDSLDFARACLGGANSIASVIQAAGEILEE